MEQLALVVDELGTFYSTLIAICVLILIQIALSFVFAPITRALREIAAEIKKLNAGRGKDESDAKADS